MIKKNDFIYAYQSKEWLYYFKDFVFLPYISNSEKLLKYIDKKNLFLKLAKLFSKQISLKGLINNYIGFDLLKNTDKKTLLTELIELYENYNSEVVLAQWMEKEKEKLKENDLFFTSITDSYRSNNPLFGKHNLNNINQSLVIINSSICFKDSLKSNKALYETIKDSQYNWLICDFPPEGMTPNHKNYKPELVFLRMDNGMEEMFSEFVPLNPQIGWFPMCQLLGFFDSKKIATENFPLLDVCLINYARPYHPDERVKQLVNFLVEEFEKPIYLEHFALRVLIYYTILEMYKSWKVKYSFINKDLVEIIKKYIEKDKDAISPLLRNIYKAL